MVRAWQREEAFASRLSVLLPVLKRDLQRDLDGGRPVVAIEDSVEPTGCHLDQLGREAGGGLVGCSGEGTVHQALGLPPDGIAKPRMTVTEVVAPP